MEIQLENRTPIKVNTEQGYSFIITDAEGCLHIQGGQGLITANNGMFTNLIIISSLQEWEEKSHPSPDEIRNRISLD